MKDKWDVVVLYDMYNQIGEAEQRNLREYVEAGKGVVSLHHAIVDYTSWPWWYEEVIGGKYFEKPEGDHPASHYKDDVPIVVRRSTCSWKRPTSSMMFRSCISDRRRDRGLYISS
jgi:type 1 glutamine amidotransferase